MNSNKIPTINLSEHIGNIVFEKKDDVIPVSEELTLEEQLVYRHNKVFKIKVQSVALPNNYKHKPKTEAQVMDWLRNRIHSIHSFYYSISLKYADEHNIKLPKK
jgi:hypothetical protein